MCYEIRVRGVVDVKNEDDYDVEAGKEPKWDKEEEKSQPLLLWGCYRGLEIDECASLTRLDV